MQKDMQERRDTRDVPLEKAGIRGLRLPLKVRGQEAGVVAKINIYTSLDPEKKGVHLSNLMDAMVHCPGCVVDRDEVRKILEIARGGAEKAFIEMEFDYFRTKKSPASGAESPLDYRCGISAELGEEFDFLIEAAVPVMTTCPDSKVLSERGAHSQRGFVTVKARGDMWFDDLIEHVEKSACDVYQILKKEDDKFVTEKSYDNPQFVEDVVRDVVVSLRKDERVEWFSVKAENMESNHNYNAYALAGPFK